MRDFDVLGEGNSNPALYVQFYLQPVQNVGKSETEGRPIFDDVEYIRIQVPGDKTTRVERPVRPEDTQAHRRAYADFKDGQDTGPSGTPLKEWPQVTRGQVEELAHFKVYTVEQLASLSDGNAQNIGPIIALRQRARDFLETAKKKAPVVALRAELEKRDAELAAVRAQMAEMDRKLAEFATQSGR